MPLKSRPRIVASEADVVQSGGHSDAHSGRSVWLILVEPQDVPPEISFGDRFFMIRAFKLIRSDVRLAVCHEDSSKLSR